MTDIHNMAVGGAFIFQRNIIMRLGLLKSLIMFFVGFATAIYVVAPEPNSDKMRAEQILKPVTQKTEQFASFIKDRLK